LQGLEAIFYSRQLEALAKGRPDLLALADPLAFNSKAEQTFAEIVSTVFLKAREAKIAVPEWAWKAIREEFRANIPTEA
jgi:hypothetical protein